MKLGIALIDVFEGAPWRVEREQHLALSNQLVRLIVLNAIAQQPRNAAWELFASEQDWIRQGLMH